MPRVDVQKQIGQDAQLQPGTQVLLPYYIKIGVKGIFHKRVKVISNAGKTYLYIKGRF